MSLKDSIGKLSSLSFSDVRMDGMAQHGGGGGGRNNKLNAHAQEFTMAMYR